MCGIAGIYTLGEKIEKGVLKKMTDSIAHRDPDGEGFWTDDTANIGFGHRRLSIIDLSDDGKQPMHYLDGRYTLTFNGEIYNYIELKEDLLKQKYTFKSKSDTEVLLALYDNKREACLNYLDGMFSFAIWDNKKQTLFCARDRFGEKPFYFNFAEGKHFYFASEMKALWAAGIPCIKDDEMFAEYLSKGKLHDEANPSRTFYQNINELDSSHYLILNKELKLITRQYYNLDNITENKTITDEEATEKFRSLFIHSVKVRMRADVPVGSSLSGGIDSSSVVMIMEQLLGNRTKQNTFSARFNNFQKDEGKYIDAVIKTCKNVTPHEVFPTGEEMMKELDRISYHQEEPFGSTSIFAQWKVMELAKKNNVTVLLDGQGADEYLAGYLPFYKLYLHQLYFTNRKKYKEEWEAYTQLRGPSGSPIEEQETFRMKTGRLTRKFLNKPQPYNSNSLKNELKRQTISGELKNLLRYADRNSMAHSREVRLPFLSHNLVDFVFSLPDSYILYNGWTKMVLRRAMKGTLPDEICWRIDKIGYATPQNDWLKDGEEWKYNIEKGKKIANSLSGEIKNSTINDWRYIMLSKFMG